MITIIPPTGRSTGRRVHMSAPTLMPTPPCASGATLHGVDTMERQQAIENALSMALYFIRQPGDTTANLWAATARTNRALTLLKHASEGAATTIGRG